MAFFSRALAPLSTLQFPLLFKELVEQSVRRRTYVQRFVFALFVMLFFFTFFVQQVGVKTEMQIAELGVGKGLIDLTFGVLIGVTYVVMPALMAPSILDEEKRGSLDLLIISGMSARSVVFQKLASRIIPVLTWQLTALPLLAIAFSLGGVSTTKLVIASLALLGTSVQAGLISLLCATKAYNVVGAFWLSILWEALCLLFILPFAGVIAGLVMMILSLPAAAVLDGVNNEIAFFSGFGVTEPFLAYYFLQDENDPFGHLFLWYTLTAVLGALPLWAMFELAVRSLRQRILRPPVQQGPNPMNATQNQWRYLRRRQDSIFARYFAALPADKPVAWMERKRTFMRGRATMEGIFFLVILPLLLISVLALISSINMGQWDTEHQAFHALIYILWCVLVPGLLLMVVNAATGNQHTGTREVLLTTPMEGSDIIGQLLQGLHVQYAFFILPLAILIVSELLLEAMGADSAAARWNKVAFYVVGYGLTIPLYFALLSWTGMILGLLLRQRLRAMLAGIMLFAAWLVVPVLLVMLLFPILDIEPGPDNLYGYFWLASPATMIHALEDPTGFVATTFRGGMWAVLGVNTVLYGGIVLLLRWFCRCYGDRLLGRQ